MYFFASSFMSLNTCRLIGVVVFEATVAPDPAWPPWPASPTSTFRAAWTTPSRSHWPPLADSCLGCQLSGDRVLARIGLLLLGFGRGFRHVAETSGLRLRLWF